MDREDWWAYSAWVAIGATIAGLSGIPDPVAIVAGAVSGAVLATILFAGWRALQWVRDRR